MGDFNAQTGNLDDSLLLDVEINNIESRANRDTKIKSNGRLRGDLCKTLEIAILNGRIGEYKHIGEYTCVTHNGKSSVDYFLAEHCCFDSLLNLSGNNFDPSLSDVHCCLVLELGCSKVSPKIESPQSATQMKRIWNEAKKKEFLKHLSTKDFSEIQACFEAEMQADTVVNKNNALLKELLLDSAKSVCALKHKRKSEFVPRNDWLDNHCQIRRRIYRRKLREANKTSNHCERKAAAKEYKLVLLQKKSKKSKWGFDTVKLQRQKKLDNSKEYWSFFKRLSRELNSIPIQKSKLYDHFKYLNNALEAPKFL